MANILKTNPRGIDIPIHKIQKVLYELKDDWGVSNLKGFPRCYILIDNEKKTIESYDGNNEYSGALVFAEENKYFFVLNEIEEQVENSYFTSSIELYFILNTKECYPNITHSADEEVRVDVVNKLLSTGLLEKGIYIETAIDKVFNRYNNRISKGYEYEVTDSMHPYHCFKIIMKLLPYDINAVVCE